MLPDFQSGAGSSVQSPGQQKQPRTSILDPKSPSVLQVLQILEDASIPCCIVGTRALRYYGAGRVADEWDICIPDEQLDAALRTIEMTGRYIPHDTPYPNPDSLRHKCPNFKLKDATKSDFALLLAPSSDSFINPDPRFRDESHTGVPYPQDIPFTKSLLVKQNRADLADFIDAQDFTTEWGETNLDFDKLQAEGVEFAARVNKKLAAAEREEAGEKKFMLGRLKVGRDLKNDWMALASAESKESRIEPLKKGRYLTRWRLKSRPGDPRLNHERKGV